jgi:NAD(P)-dependent dehydrogenase (short-subunit alcohol dehydrogenase family)
LVCFITGAANGIGRALFDVALADGVSLIVADRIALAAAANRNGNSRSFETLQMDVADEHSVNRAIATLRTSRVDILINNAGVYLDVEQGLLAGREADVRHTLEVNSLGPMRVTRALLPRLLASAEPKVVNISSEMGSIAGVRDGASYAYRMSKAALNMFTKTLSIEYPKVISVSVHPGQVQTRMGGVTAPLSALESANAIWALIQGLGHQDSGRFMNYEGGAMAW